jgi:2-dehydro-3-deoxygalactonokinase
MAITHADGRHDVMRSEEVKALGALARLGRDSALLAIPGTHCKWIRVEAGRIVDFHTAMTGDFFGLLSEHGSLAPLFAAAPDDAGLEARSFGQGLALAALGADLLFDVWQVRSRILHAPDPPPSPRSCLSGILIGHEVRQARAFHPGAADVVLVSDPGPRAACYQRACASFGLPVSATVASEAAVHAGLTAIRKELA